MAKLILRIPNKIGKIATWAMVVFFIYDCVMSGASLARWSERQQDLAPSNSFEQMLDERFPDERMQRVYINMVFDD